MAGRVHHMDYHHGLSVLVRQGDEVEVKLSCDILPVHVEQVLRFVGHVQLEGRFVIVVHMVGELEEVLLVLDQVDDLWHGRFEHGSVVTGSLAYLPVVQEVGATQSYLIYRRGTNGRVVDVQLLGNEPDTLPPVGVGVVNGLEKEDPLVFILVMEGNSDSVPVGDDHEGDGPEQVVLVGGRCQDLGRRTGVIDLDVVDEDRPVAGRIVGRRLDDGLVEAQFGGVPREVPDLLSVLFGLTDIHPPGPVEVGEHHVDGIILRYHAELLFIGQVVTLGRHEELWLGGKVGYRYAPNGSMALLTQVIHHGDPNLHLRMLTHLVGVPMVHP